MAAKRRSHKFVFLLAVATLRLFTVSQACAHLASLTADQPRHPWACAAACERLPATRGPDRVQRSLSALACGRGTGCCGEARGRLALIWAWSFLRWFNQY